MTFAAIPWLSISINLLLVVFVIVCLLMTLLILMQRPKQEGLGAAFGGGLTDQVFGARTTNVLQRGTVYCGSLFFVFALVLAILIGHKNKDSDLLNQNKPGTEEAGSATPGDTPSPDAGTGSGDQGQPSSLLEELDDAKTPDDEADQPAEPEGDSGDAEGTTEADQPAEDSSDQVEQP